MMAENLATQGITSIIFSNELVIEAKQVEQVSVDDGQRHFAPLQAYNEALGAIRDVFKDIKSGRIPNSDKIITVVTNLASLTVQDPAALLGLSMIKDYDNYTFNHSVNVGVIAMTLGASLSMTRDEVADVGIAGFLHDIGKTRMEKRILNKPGKLSAAEFELMKKHSEDGSKIISEMTGLKPEIAQAVLGHHLRYNRQGYPEWARDIPVGVMAEIIAVADCYDAMTTLRVYQQPLNPKAALDRIRSFAGTHLDDRLVDKFVEIMGLYPVGTLIRLDNNEIAVVFKPNPGNKEAPTVKVIIDATGQRLEVPVVQRLVDDEGPCYANIVDVVDPLVRNIDVAEFLN
jgi:HD-GYP domain-containing protein (c-di-GMP phosphodiesterase class II)